MGLAIESNVEFTCSQCKLTFEKLKAEIEKLQLQLASYQKGKQIIHLVS